jgi:hypothetical protein
MTGEEPDWKEGARAGVIGQAKNSALPKTRCQEQGDQALKVMARPPFHPWLLA